MPEKRAHRRDPHRIDPHELAEQRRRERREEEDRKSKIKSESFNSLVTGGIIFFFGMGAGSILCNIF